ncbi:hypothetical protein JXB41_06285 [Candidatus Woesearchaeota archaeon]|nr:hypothetical protein [Candidatus Woesearchaeota archaeon]
MAKLYKNIYYIIILFLIIPICHSSFTYTRTFSTYDGYSGTGVTVKWLVCTNTECTTVKSSPTSNLFSPNPINLGSQTSISFTVPDCPENNGYLVGYYKEGYRPFIDGPWTYNCYYSHHTYPTINLNFNREENCKAEFTPTITSCAEAGLPLSILTDTNLDAQTASAFSSPYPDPEFRSFFEVETDMSVDVKKQGSSTSVSGFPKDQTAKIYTGTSHNFQFLWQTSKNTDSGDYVVTMTSTVPDEKCDPNNMEPVTQFLTVHIAPSLDGCVAELTFQKDTADSQIALNQPIAFSGSHLNTYQNWSYTSISACSAENAQITEGKIFTTAYTFRIINYSNSQAVYTNSGNLLTNTGYNQPRAFTLSWTPQKPGSYIARMEIQSTGSTGVCNGEGTSNDIDITFNIGHDNDGDGWYDVEGDCNDNNEYIFPEYSNYYCDCDNGDGYSQGTNEICDLIDNDCDGVIDDGITCNDALFYCDEDGDGLFRRYITATCYNAEVQCMNQYSSCSQEIGTDCDDTDYNIRGEMTYYRDLDGDGYGNPSAPHSYCPNNVPSDYVLNNGDCDDTPITGVSIHPGATEICNNRNDDCDSATDEDENYNPLTQTCYTGPFGTMGIGICTSGIRTCINGVFGNCAGQITPVQETCDNLDNDCDSATDEDENYNPLTQTCYTGPSGTMGIGICTSGIRTCTNGVFGSCAGQIIPVQETCDAVDNDCDGSTDEGCSCRQGETRSCGTDTGACQPGMQTCDSAGQWSACTGAVLPVTEICDNIDNDCDGSTDEDFNIEECRHICVSQGFIWTDSNHCCGNDPNEGNRLDGTYESKEICGDGIDNECDGLFDCNDDECSPMAICKDLCFDYVASCNGACTNLTDLAYCGSCENSCYDLANAVNLKCINKHCIFECKPGYANCNKDVPGCEQNILYSKDNCGACYRRCSFANAEPKCENGICSIDECYPEYVDLNENEADGCECMQTNHGIEICDNKDNNCNGDIDENCRCENGDTQECGISKGQCRKGISTCINGQWSACSGNIDPSAEVCDSVDNDCDGRTDEDVCECYRNQVQSCNPPEEYCSTGEQICVNNKWSECMNLCDPPEIKINIISPDRDIYNQTRIPVKFTTNLAAKCKYSLNDGNWHNIIKQEFHISAKKGENKLEITCNDIYHKTKHFKVTSGEDSTPKKSIVIDEIPEEELLNKTELSDEEKKDIMDYKNQTLNAMEQSLEVSKLGNRTILTNSFDPFNELNDTTLYLEIPKCMAEYVDLIDFHDENFDIIQDDPIIAWHFVEIKDRVDLTYEVEGEIPEWCLEQIKALPIAKYIGKRIHRKSLLNQFLPLLAIPVVSILFIYFHKFTPHKFSEKELNMRAIDRHVKKTARLIEREFSNDHNEQKIRNYLQMRGYSPELTNKILERLNSDRFLEQ